MTSYSLPTDLPVSSGFGPRGGGFHSGIDYSDGVAGHPIHAVADGIVTYAAYEAGGLGNTVTLTHPDGNKSGYGHMQNPTPLHLGQQVRRGDFVGNVGSTGASTGPHLHLWMGQNPNTLAVNPLVYLASSPNPGDDVTPEQMAQIGTWMQEQRKLEQDQLGQWMQEQSALIVSTLNKKLDLILAEVKK